MSECRPRVSAEPPVFIILPALVIPDRQPRAALTAPTAVVIYDGACVVCTRMIDMLREWDRQGVLEIIPSQDPSVRVRFPWITPAAHAASIQFVELDERTWTGAAALRRILRAVHRGKAWSWLLALPFAESAYAWFARHRYGLGCGEHCELPIRK
jgi:predicted DCC family thiol-disulfide oxidoreductase YuxK